MILICYGTRPEHIKISPLLKEMDGVIKYKTLFTGQHVDLVKNISAKNSLRGAKPHLFFPPRYQYTPLISRRDSPKLCTYRVKVA